jgi:hypothetical protein
MLMAFPRNGAIALIASYLLLLLFVQVSERVMRHRAERLLVEMRALQVNKSTWGDLQRLRMRWARGAITDLRGRAL